MDQITARGNDSATMPYYLYTQEMVTNDDAISYTFMCRNKRFMIKISATHLEGEGRLVEAFYEFMEDIDNPDVLCEFETWAVDPVDEHVRRLALTSAFPPRMPTSLLQYYAPQTYVFELVNQNGVLAAVERPYNAEIDGDPSPKVLSVPYSGAGFLGAESATSSQESDTSVIETPRPEHRSVICQSILPDVPIIPASHLVRVAGPDSVEEDMCDLPQIVRNIDTNQVYFFKAADERGGFQREVETLARIRSLAEHNPGLRTSRIAGLVNWDGKESLLMGMLLERIEGPTLYEAMTDASVGDKRRWIRQIDDTIRWLHAYNLVWGDVKPDNVIISPSSGAILVDFGGGCTLEYIDWVNSETREGDLQGLGRLWEKLTFGF